MSAHPHSEPVPLKTPIERAAAEAKRFGRLAHVAVEARHRLLDEEPFHFFEAHVFDARRLIAVDSQAELPEPDDRSLRHQHATLDGMIELADVARPGMVEQRLKKDPQLTEQDVLEHCKRELTGCKRPKYVEFRTELPKTNVGKILRRALRDERKAA